MSMQRRVSPSFFGTITTGLTQGAGPSTGSITVEFRFFEPPREMEIGSKNREFEKSKVASNQTCFTMEWFYKIQEGRQQRYIIFLMCEPSLFTNETCI